MRTFPRAVPSRVSAPAAALVALALLAPLVVSAPASAVTVSTSADGRKARLQHRQHRIDHQQRGAQEDLEESSAGVRRAEQQLTGARAGLATARTALATAQAAVRTAQTADAAAATALRTAQATLATATTQLAAARRAVAAQHVTVVDTITDYYEQGDPQMLALTSLMDSQTPDDVTRKLSLMGTVVSGQTQTWDDLQAAETRLQQRKRAVRTAETAVATQRRAAAAQLTRTRTAETTARTAAGTVRRAVGVQAAAVESARRLRRGDRAVLRRLAAQEKRVKARILAEARREAAAKRSASYHGATGGVLLRPVDGPVTSPYGWRIHPIYHYWGLHDGTDFGAACGTPLRAVSSGTVLSEYYSSVWGNRLYLNLGSFNGRNVTVIYNHLSAYRAHTGDRVARGATVGYVGTTGWSTGCHLHFTVMVDGATVDPMTWIS